MDKFRYLKISLVFLLAYIGVKMLLVHHHPIPNEVSLSIIGGILAVGILASLVMAPERHSAPIGGDMERLVRITYRQARRAVILLLGSSVLAAGLAMVSLPGPAFIVIPMGLAILAVEFAWARRWLNRVKAELAEVKEKLGSKESTGNE
jgi:tellurite resistance protein TerC